MESHHFVLTFPNVRRKSNEKKALSKTCRKREKKALGFTIFFSVLCRRTLTICSRHSFFFLLLFLFFLSSAWRIYYRKSNESTQNSFPIYLSSSSNLTMASRCEEEENTKECDLFEDVNNFFESFFYCFNRLL